MVPTTGTTVSTLMAGQPEEGDLLLEGISQIKRADMAPAVIAVFPKSARVQAL